MRATFPHLALWQDVQFHLAGQSLDPEESINGTETIVPTLRGRWKASCNFVLHGEATTLQWQAFLAQMQGRIGTTLVPVRSRHRPKDARGMGLPFRQIGGLAGAQTFEHFGFANAKVARITLAAARGLRATELDLAFTSSTGLRPGQFFSIGERLHRVQLHWEPSMGTHRVMIEPPLREAAANGARLEIQAPVCRMRMVTETEGLFDQNMAVIPSLTVNFVEAD